MRTKSNTSEAPSFLQKTYDMLNNSELSEIISWSDEGDAFTIKNIKEFSSQVLPRYFKHCNFASFVRQLNMYDFHKIRSTGNDNTFKHSHFIRDRIDLLKEIKRKSTEPNWAVTPVNNLTKSEMAPIIQKMIELHKKNTATEELVRSLEEKVVELTQERTILDTQLWKTQERVREIEQAIYITASLMKKAGKEFPMHIKAIFKEPQFKSIQPELPQKRRRIEQLSIEELLKVPDTPKDSNEKEENSPLNDVSEAFDESSLEHWLET